MLFQGATIQQMKVLEIHSGIRLLMDDILIEHDDLALDCNSEPPESDMSGNVY